MISNYILIALRNLRKHFTYSVINIAGLGLGLATCLLLTLWIQHELSYDDFHHQKESIYRVSLEYSFGGPTSQTSVSPTALLPALQKNFAEIETGVRFFNSAATRPIILRRDEYLFEESRFYFADSTFFDVFSFKLLQGNADKVLSRPNSIVLTQSMVKKYFADENPVGKVVQVNSTTDYTVTGVMEDVPTNSLLQFDFVASFSSLPVSKEFIWWSANYQTYVVVSPKADVRAMEIKIAGLVKKELGNELTNPGDYVKYNFTPMKDIYLYSEVEEPEIVGSIQYVYIFSAIVLLILLIACINYINLATAKASDRAKEVGVRKVVGALQKQLFFQFIGESVVITVLSYILALFLATLALPFFNELTGKFFTITSIFSTSFLSFSMVVLFSIAVLAGVYPALVITSYKPVNILKGNFRTSGRGVWLRQSLVVFQFCISIILVIGTIVILKQVEFIQSKRLGYEKENVIILPLDRKTQQVYSQLKTEFIRSNMVAGMGRAAEAPSRIQGGYTINLPGSDDHGMIVTAMPIDEGFIPTLGMELLAGRNFEENDFLKLKVDTLYSFILNETAVRELSLEPDQVIGTPVRLNGRHGTIKGIVKDFHFATMHKHISPLVLFTEESQFNFIFVKLQPGNANETLAALRAICNNLIPHRPFEYKFLTEKYTALYLGEQRMGFVCSVFAGLAIIIACLGLLGLVAFAASQKAKEIGIRKVLGATSANIVLLITKDFATLVLLAILFGIPASWYLMEHYWLNNFAYRTSVGIWPFIAAAAGCIVVAFGTASYQAIKAALLNPANTLRNE